MLCFTELNVKVCFTRTSPYFLNYPNCGNFTRGEFPTRILFVLLSCLLLAFIYSYELSDALLVLIDYVIERVRFIPPAKSVKTVLTETSYTCSRDEQGCSRSEQPGVQNMNTKKYTVEGNTNKEHTALLEYARKRTEFA